MVIDELWSGRAGPVLLDFTFTLAPRTAAEYGSLHFADLRAGDRGKPGLVSYTSTTFIVFLMMTG